VKLMTARWPTVRARSRAPAIDGVARSLVLASLQTLGITAGLLTITAFAPNRLVAQDSIAADSVALDSLAGAADSVQIADEPEPVTDARAAQDEAIRNQLQAVFDRVPDLADVDVTVDAGVVHLEGTVLRSETRTRAGELAAQMDGVLFLDNRIQESTSLEQQLRPTWARLRALGYGAVAKLPLVLVAVVVVGLAGFLGSWVARWGGPKALRLGNPFLQSLLQRLLRFVVILGALLVALDLLNATALVGALVGTAGLAGIALGFAFKDIVENYLAGTILALRQPFEKNDHILVEGFEGKVVRLTARETIMMSLDGNHVRLPNALILRSPMTNFSRNPLRRFHFDAGVGSSDDLARVREIAAGAMRDVEGILRDPPPQALVIELGESSVTMRFLAWVDQRAVDMVRVRGEAIRTVKTRLEAEGLTLPSPEYLVRFSGGTPTLAADGPTPSGPEVAPTRPPSLPAEATIVPPVEPADVTIDLTLDKQIEEDRRASDEPDLLDNSTPSNFRTT